MVYNTNMVLQTKEYQSLADEVKDIITEYVFQSRWMLIDGHWQVGKRIRDFSKDKSITELTAGLAVDTGISERTLWYCVKFFDEFPDLQKLPGGKNVSWNKIVTTYLTDGKEKVKESIKLECPKCHYVGPKEEF